MCLLYVPPFPAAIPHFRIIGTCDKLGCPRVCIAVVTKMYRPTLTPDDWEHLPFFLAAIRAGSFRGAAGLLGTAQPTISRHIKALEVRLGEPVCMRTSKGIQATPVGEKIFRLAEEIESTIQQVHISGSDGKDVSGDVRLWTSDGVGGYWLTPRLSDFHEIYPAITVKLICSHAPPDMAKLEADIVVTYHEPTHPDVVVITNAMMCFKPTASVQYLRRFGTPTTFDELRNHRICNHLHYPTEGGWRIWTECLRNHEHIIYETNSSLALGMVTIMGFGISMQPVGIDDRERSLVSLDIESFTASVPFWLVCHRDMKNIPRMRAMIEYIRGVLFNNQSGSGRGFVEFSLRDGSMPRTNIENFIID